MRGRVKFKAKKQKEIQKEKRRKVPPKVNLLGLKTTAKRLIDVHDRANEI